MNLLGNFGKTLLNGALSLVTELFWREAALLGKLVAQVEKEGLDGDAARKEVQRRFRKLYKGEIGEVLLNLLIESVLMKRPENLDAAVGGPQKKKAERGEG